MRFPLPFTVLHFIVGSLFLFIWLHSPSLRFLPRIHKLYLCACGCVCKGHYTVWVLSKMQWRLSSLHICIYQLLSSWLTVYFEHVLVCQFIFTACSGNGFVYISHLKALDFLESNLLQVCVCVTWKCWLFYLHCFVDISCWPLLEKKKKKKECRQGITLMSDSVHFAHFQVNYVCSLPCIQNPMHCSLQTTRS